MTLKSVLALAVLMTATVVCRANLIDVYATTFPAAYPTLESVNLATGHVTVLGTVNYGNLVNDIAVNPLTGVLYGLNGANLFTIGKTGAVTPVAASGMNGSMETMAFDSRGNLYIGTQSSLYEFRGGTATLVGNYGDAPYLNGRGQNIRFENGTLYLANTGSGGNTELYTVSTNTGVATFVGVITNQASVVLGNSGGHVYGSSVPAINGGAGSADLLDFGVSITTYESGGVPVVNYTVVESSFPQNVNFTGVGDVAAVPEPGVGILLIVGLAVGGAVWFRRK